jgi:hypothetical protein
MNKQNLLPMLLSLAILFAAMPALAQDENPAWKAPRSVTPGSSGNDCLQLPPSDAVILFDGTDLSMFEAKNGGDANWTVSDGVFTIPKMAGDIQTRMKFNDFQLHIEWRIPENITGSGQLRGNSGIFLQGQYEIQVLDSYSNETYFNGQAGSVYSQMPPLVNATRKPGEWNVFDIIYTAPTFKTDGTYRTRPVVTVIHNGVLVQNQATILGITYKDHSGYPPGQDHGAGPIILQDHDFPVSYRNIWIREL